MVGWHLRLNEHVFEKAPGRDLIFLSREGRDLGVAFQAPPGSQASSRGDNRSILKEISPGCSLEGLILKLKLQYFGHLMQRADSLEKTLMLGKIEGRRRRG